MKNTTQVLSTVIIFLLLVIGIQNNKPPQPIDNSIKFVWEGLEKDIPKNGEYIQISGTDENTVYINPIDE